MTLAKGSLMPRPAVLATYSEGDRVYSAISLIDSGADMSAMDSKIAETLNLDLTGPKTKSYGIDGTIETVISSTTVTIQNESEKHIIPIPVRVLFMKEGSPICSTLLGRKGFFDKFLISIDEYNQHLVLEPNETLEN
ncbi:hypothetical protein AUP07_0511 [methanogenic archaeon mixed culture ISO4-G1]|nr:hypothetical protein AUP07_0511 [methanogenic archaeon mixed culture ISO4-G1]